MYKKYSWLTGVHIHVGSQGLPLELFVKAARVSLSYRMGITPRLRDFIPVVPQICMDFVAEVERVTGRQMESVDIGGGLSTSYTEPGEPEQFSYAEYRARLDEALPELFSGKYRVVKRDFYFFSISNHENNKNSRITNINLHYSMSLCLTKSNAISYRIITEFGRSLTLKAGKTVSRFDTYPYPS